MPRQLSHEEALALIDRAIALMDAAHNQGGKAEDLAQLKDRFFIMLDTVSQCYETLTAKGQ
jgi:hypothetical protein